MSRRNFRANATDINKMPDDVRYIFIVKYNDGSVSSCATYQSLSKVKLDNITSFLSVDVKENLIVEFKEMNEERLAKLLEDWRTNYFNYDWELINN